MAENELAQAATMVIVTLVTWFLTVDARNERRMKERHCKCPDGYCAYCHSRCY